MAKDTVERIREAERAGEELIEQSRQRAAKITANAAGKGELIMNDAKRELKDYELKKAEETSDAVKKQSFEAQKSSEALLAALDDSARSNYENACAAAMEILL